MRARRSRRARGIACEDVGQRRVLVRAQHAVGDETTALPGEASLLEPAEHRRDVRRLFGERAHRVERLSGRHQRRKRRVVSRPLGECDGVATDLEADVAKLDDELASGQAVEPKLAGRIRANVAIDRDRPGVGARTRASCRSGSRRCREDAPSSHDSANRERGCRRAARPRAGQSPATSATRSDVPANPASDTTFARRFMAPPASTPRPYTRSRHARSAPAPTPPSRSAPAYARGST